MEWVASGTVDRHDGRMSDPFQAALATFPWASVTLTCALPAEFAELPDLPDRLRGAIGNRLRERPAGGDAALLHSLMHDDKEGLDAAIRPVVLQTDRGGNSMLQVRLNLAGTAANLMVTAAHALRAALMGGIRMGTDIRYRVALEPGPPEFARHVGFADNSQSGADRLYLRLATPLSLRIGKAHGKIVSTATAPSIQNLPWNIESRFRRLSGAFHLPVTAPSGIPRRLTDLLEATEDATYPQPFIHYSRSHRDPVLIPAVQGHMIYAGRCQVYLPLLAFARVFHAGSGTAFGLGRIEYAAS